jgi:hypothetical protein
MSCHLLEFYKRHFFTVSLPLKDCFKQILCVTMLRLDAVFIVIIPPRVPAGHSKRQWQPWPGQLEPLDA